MKKVIRLTEKDLTNLVKRVIQEQYEMRGKTVTLYTSKEDAMAAANSGKSNPQAEGAMIGSIVSINDITNIGLELLMNFTNLSNAEEKMYIRSGGNSVFYNRQLGSFRCDNIGSVSVYYNESLKRALDKMYFETDFASTQKPKGTQSGMA